MVSYLVYSLVFIEDRIVNDILIGMVVLFFVNCYLNISFSNNYDFGLC